MMHRVAVLLVLYVLCVPLRGAGGAEPWDALAERAAAEHGELGRRAAEFLREHRPEGDADLDAAVLWSNLDYAIRARHEFPWARAVPEAMFLNDVLPYAVFDETREDWRPGFYETAGPIVAGCETAEQAIQALNREFFNAINVHYNTGRKAPNQSPSESVAQGRATCTGLAIILVDACRAVGIPARAVGVANWHNKRGNHTWVEAHDGERWRFTGADEYNTEGLDRGWFRGDASKAIAGDPIFGVWATSWRETGHPFPMVWTEDIGSVHAVDVTHRYLKTSNPKITGVNTATRHLRAWDGGVRLAATARVIDASGAALGEVTTRAGTTDLNDMPSVSLEPGGRYTIELTHGGVVYVAAHVATAPGDETLDLRLGSMPRALSRDEAESAVQDAWGGVVRTVLGELRDGPGDAVVVGDHTLKYLVREFGSAPEGERSLWISMHGGGGAPAEVNDNQWRNQIKLYEPEEGYYVAPRAPTDSWNLWHRGHIDPLLDALITRFVVTRGVDPDRVYLMGYSAGGDGVYQLAPRMADRFAAAAMMAGHPNETTPEGLRNLPFAIFMGGDDKAYNRNTVAEKWGSRLAGLAADDPGGYPHLVRIYEGYGHWMNGDDKEALPWMSRHTRSAWPDRVVWKQDDVLHPRFYWLGVAPADTEERAVVTALVEGQTIAVESADVRALTLHLRDGLVDLDAPITVTANGETVYRGRVRRTRDAIERSLETRRDPVLAATARLEVAW